MAMDTEMRDDKGNHRDGWLMLVIGIGLLFAVAAGPVEAEAATAFGTAGVRSGSYQSGAAAPELTRAGRDVAVLADASGGGDAPPSSQSVEADRQEDGSTGTGGAAGAADKQAGGDSPAESAAEAATRGVSVSQVVPERSAIPIPTPGASKTTGASRPSGASKTTGGGDAALEEIAARESELEDVVTDEDRREAEAVRAGKGPSLADPSQDDGDWDEPGKPAAGGQSQTGPGRSSASGGQTQSEPGSGAGKSVAGQPYAGYPSVAKDDVTFALVTSYWGWGVEIFKKADFLSEKIDTAYPGDYYRILQKDSNGWARISYGGGDAYLYMGGDVKEVGINELVQRDSLRSSIVNYALQFVGNAYVWGGTDPNTGADCSGFVQYVYKHAAGVQLDRTTREQVYNGKMIHALEMRPGDLMFYGDTLGTIHHVTMYIGNGQVVHASDSKSGIKISPWNYRDDWICVVNVLGDEGE